MYRKQYHERKIHVRYSIIQVKKMISSYVYVVKVKPTTNILSLIEYIVMYLVRVLEGHKPPGCPVERGLPLHGKRRESVGAFPSFICGLEKNCSINKKFLYWFFSSLDDIIMHREWANCFFVEADKALRYISMLN